MADESKTFYRPIADIYEDLAKPIPARLIQQKDTGSFKADYVPHYTIRNLLDHYAPGWEWDETPRLMGDTMYVKGKLTIFGLDGEGGIVSVSRVAIGNEEADVRGYGDASSNSSAQALRRAAMAHGLGRHLWEQ